VKKIDLKKVVAWLSSILRCPICNFQYNLGNLRVIESQHDEILGEAHIVIHSDCQKCQGSLIFNVDINGLEVISVGMITDLTGKDSNKFKNSPPISINDVISIHKNLKNFDGDFVKAINPKQ
jgi:hypothetical protein